MNARFVPALAVRCPTSPTPHPHLQDFVLFGRPLNVRSAAGILMTMGGVFWYTHLKLDKARREQEAASSDSTSVQMAPKGGARSPTSNEVVGGDDERVALAKA